MKPEHEAFAYVDAHGQSRREERAGWQEESGPADRTCNRGRYQLGGIADVLFGW